MAVYRLIVRNVWKYFAQNETREEIYVYVLAGQFSLLRAFCADLNMKTEDFDNDM
jgi:hypothetical protein